VPRVLTASTRTLHCSFYESPTGSSSRTTCSRRSRARYRLLQAAFKGTNDGTPRLSLSARLTNCTPVQSAILCIYARRRQRTVLFFYCCAVRVLFSFLTLHRAVSEFGKDFFGSAVISPLAKHLRAGFSGEDQKGKKQQKKEVSSMS